MSWSIRFVGKTENVVAALEAESAKLTGTSKTEYDAALPHLVALVRENSSKPPYGDKFVDIDASGSASMVNGEMVYSSCQVTLKSPAGSVV